MDEHDEDLGSGKPVQFSGSRSDLLSAAHQLQRFLPISVVVKLIVLGCEEHEELGGGHAQRLGEILDVDDVKSPFCEFEPIHVGARPSQALCQ